MIYRGQRYGDAVGEWWTSNEEDATGFAMSRGGNRTWVVLSVDEDDEKWLAQWVYSAAEHAIWYRIPLDALRARWRGVRIHKGAISIEV